MRVQSKGLEDAVVVMAEEGVEAEEAIPDHTEQGGRDLAVIGDRIIHRPQLYTKPNILYLIV